MKKITYIYKESLNTDQKQIVIKGMYKSSKLDDFLSGSINDSITSAIKTDSFNGDYGKNIPVYTNTNISKIILVGLGSKDKLTNDKLRSLAAKISSQLNNEYVSIDSESFNLNDSFNAQAFSEGLILGTYKFLNYKSKKDKKINLEKITFVGNVDSENINKGKALAYAVHFSRDLGNHPANILTPEYMANLAVELSDKCDMMTSNIIDIKDFVKMGFGSFYSVAKASVLPAKMILVEYNGGKEGTRPLALVGKGLTFDTGGISLKPPARMDEMKFDMCGSGTVLGVMNAVVTLRPKLNIIFAIGATENMPGGGAQRVGDIVTSMNGKTIEIENTDAEGRLTLADAVEFANQRGAAKIIDVATLTGAMVISLGHGLIGAFGNDDDLIQTLISAGEKTGEKIWHMPLDEASKKQNRSKVADIKNTGGRAAGSVTAAHFIGEFVGDTPWVHLDIAGTAMSASNKGWISQGATGYPCRTLIETVFKLSY